MGVTGVTILLVSSAYITYLVITTKKKYKCKRKALKWSKAIEEEFKKWR